MINHNGKEGKKFNANIGITESLCSIAVVNTTLHINCTSKKKRIGDLKKNTLKLYYGDGLFFFSSNFSLLYCCNVGLI